MVFSARRRAPHCAALCLAILTASAAPAEAQIFRYRELCDHPPTLTGLSEGEGLGALVQPAGDLNGDGIGDLLVGASDLRRPNEYPRGGYRVFAMPNGELLWRIQGDVQEGLGYFAATEGNLDGDGVPDMVLAGNNTLRPISGAGFQQRGVWTFPTYVTSLDFMGDVNGDGVDDVLVGFQGIVRVLSGVDGSLIYERQDPTTSSFAAVVLRLPDSDGDGVPEFLATRPYADHGSIRGDALIYSGASGTLLHGLRSDESVFGETYGLSWAARVGDVDADGVEDFSISDTRFLSPDTGERGRVYVYSGADYRRLHTLEPHAADGYRVGTGRGWVGDVDGDGHDDLLYGHDNGTWAPEGSPSAAAVSIYSGRGGHLLRRLHGRSTQSFGRGPTGIGDVDGDGAPDFIVGQPRWFSPNSLDGEVHILSTRNAGIPYYGCPGEPNSTGRSGKLVFPGRLSVSHDELYVQGNNVPGESFVDLVYARRAANTPFGSAGCLRAPVFRAGRLATTTGGSFGDRLRFLSGPLSVGPGTVVAGSTWIFQARFPDPLLGGSGITNSVELTFCP